ncbi:MAG: hypothetical protein RLO01_01905 [Thalassobaculaceae bacterium]
MGAPLVLSLCDFTGEWSRPYREAGYRVRQVDLAHGDDVRLMRAPGEPVRGILAAPPCCHFSRAGARWWKEKGDAALLEGLSVVDACLRLVAVCEPDWWVLENPIGRLKDYLGDPVEKFDPCDFGDPSTKRTWLWGRFNSPARARVEPERVDWITRVPGGRNQKVIRSATPAGFARAFFEANP